MNVEEPISGCAIIQGGMSPWMFGTGPDAGLGFANTGVIAATYTEAEVVRMTVEVGTYHGGIFEFRIQDVGSNADPDGSLWDSLPLLTVESFSPVCDDPSVCGAEPCLLTKTCAQVPLNPYGEHNYHVDMDVRLPDNLQCTHCVLQWRYTASNSCPPDFISCSTAEKFWNCADIQITSLPTDNSAIPVITPTAMPVKTTTTMTPLSTPTTSRTMTPTRAVPLPWSNECLCQYETSCIIDSDCCSGQLCHDYGSGLRQCLENAIYFEDKSTLPNPSCKATSTSPFVGGDDYGCTYEGECCNPSAVCSVNRLCTFPTTCGKVQDPQDRTAIPSNAPVHAPVSSPTEDDPVQCSDRCYAVDVSDTWFTAVVDGWCQVDCERLVYYFPNRCTMGCRPAPLNETDEPLQQIRNFFAFN